MILTSLSVSPGIERLELRREKSIPFLEVMEVEVIKIGSILVDLSNSKNINVVTEAGPTHDWYLDILKKELGSEYNFSESRRKPPARLTENFSSRVAGVFGIGYSIKGDFITRPENGQSFTLGSWGHLCYSLPSKNER